MLNTHPGYLILHLTASPWENPFIESFHSRLRDEVLNRESFASRLEAQVILNDYRPRYNDERPHSSLGYKTPSEMRALSCSPSAGTFVSPDEQTDQVAAA